MIEQMDCQTYRSHLDEWMDGELDPELTPAMEAHRNSCPDCAEETCRAQETLALIRTLDADVPVPVETQAAWRRAVREEAAQRRRFRFSAGMRTAGSIAAAFLVLAGCTLGFRSAGLLNPAEAPLQTVAASEPVERTRARAQYSTDTGYTYGPARAHAIPYAYVASDGEADDPSADSGAEPISASGEPDLAAARSDDGRSGTLMIRSAERTIATDSYDAAAQNIRDLADQYGGYLETDSTATGNDGLRTGELIAAIPALEADSFLQTIEHVGNVTYTAEHYEDASITVRDASDRIGVLEAERDRLIELIATASDAEELSRLNALMQSTLTEIDSLQAESNRLSNELETVRVTIRLEELYAMATAEPTQAPSLSRRMSTAFSESAQNLKSFVHDMIVSLTIIAPFALAALAAAAVITAIVLAIRRLVRKHRQNKNS